MGIFTKAEKEGELVALFDIRSSSVGGALFRVQKSGIPKIILSFREPIIFKKTIDINRFVLSIIKPLNIIADKISTAGIGVPERIFCILSSPWFVSQTRIINLKKNTPFTVTTKLIDDLIKKEINIFEEEHLAKYTEKGNKIRLIELKNIKTMLNGYETANPLDQKSKELEITVFISMSPEQVLSKIEEAVKRYFHRGNIKFVSFALSSFAVVRDMFINQENFLLIDVGGEVTDISMIKKNVLRESISFPLGQNFIIRGVASALGSTLGEAESLISLLQDEHGDASTEKKLNPIIDKLKMEWLKKFQEALANISRDISIPATIFLSTEMGFADFFGKTIKTEQFNQYTLTESKFEITFLDTETLHGIATFDKSAIRDPFIIIDSVYINRFLIHSASPR
ncbi:hypothetical protein A3A95_00970 [Candidatus Nomurabacteria bacterium RIFCSPLOWO2_01_FULL_39_18]|uniref:SHS2 domain-containing protein n=1 Tax=Candidatus Nomurabacteria bacterium RIFCSPHIGHO2_01_FULL_40_24b TaxID=1801739 RepID=A0A1F6V6W7_9BACT|nr:MAG: hypothetical protein A2647_02770 [Candidatus Nomurabacteria bacterium RIFCSPHIGHO2_01_FULL_40_24b]OGI89879.1 MAG: hypothetical protein A3A95_00970 [Candidatus Nomurabacteria bacterium RIFCSPLOWO2_01_FULL_39_18]